MTSTELRLALRGLRLSQREFARRLGVDTQTVNRWVMGTIPVPGYAGYVVDLLQLAVWRPICALPDEHHHGAWVRVDVEVGALLCPNAGRATHYLLFPSSPG